MRVKKKKAATERMSIILHVLRFLWKGYKTKEKVYCYWVLLKKKSCNVEIVKKNNYIPSIDITKGISIQCTVLTWIKNAAF